MKNVNVSAKWSFVLTTKDTTICNYIGAKRWLECISTWFFITINLSIPIFSHL